MNNEQQQIIDEVYKNYKSMTHKNNEKNHYGGYSKWGDNPLISGVQHLTKDSFIQMIKIDSEFSERWGLKIEEMDLSMEKRLEIADNINKNIRGDLYSFSFNNPSYVGDSNRSDDEQRHLSLNEFNIPTKIITTFYKGKTIESYE